MPKLSGVVAPRQTEGTEMNGNPIWPYVVIIGGGIVLFLGSIISLVMTTRKTGVDQYHWAFQTVVLIIVVSMLVSLFARK